MKKTSLFRRLQSYRPRPERDSKEDFFTEALCYVLEKNQKVLKKYIEFLLENLEEEEKCPEVNQNSISIETQYQFGRKRPDVRIEFKDEKDDNYLIVCEHKINANVDVKQLINYDNTLKGQRNSTEPVIKDGWLVLITKNFFSQTSMDEEPEQQFKLPNDLIKFTWREVYPLLLSCKEDNLVDEAYRELYNDFLTYMEELEMKQPEKFTAMELAEFCRIPKLLGSLNECRGGEAWKVFESLDNLRKQAYQAGSQLWKYGRWAYYRTLAQSDDDGEFRVFMGLYLDIGKFKAGFGLNENDDEYPELVIWLESNPAKKSHEKYYNYCKEFSYKYDSSDNCDSWKLVSNQDMWAMVYVHKSIADFIKDGEKQIEEIQKWFAEHLHELKKFLEENPIEE